MLRSDQSASAADTMRKELEMYDPTRLVAITAKHPAAPSEPESAPARRVPSSLGHEMTQRQGGDLRAYGAGQISIDLSACHNRYGPPRHILKSVQDVLEANPDDLAPPPYGCEVPYVEAFAAHLGGVDPAEMLPGRGVTEFLTILGRVMRGSSIGVVVPDYTETLKLFHYADFHGPDIPEQDSAEQRLHRLRHAMARHTEGMVILSNPCNPTGHILGRQDLLQAAADHPSTLLVVDEEYIGLCGGPELSLAGTELDNVAVLQSTGKSFGMVGTRAGVLWTRNTLLRDRVAAELIRWPLSLLDARLATAALRDQPWLTVTRAAIHDDADRLQNVLTAAFGSRVVDTQLHYRFVYLPEPQPVAEHLVQHGIAVRAFSADGQCVSGIRVAAPKGPQELARLKAALDTLPGDAHGVDAVGGERAHHVGG